MPPIARLLLLPALALAATPPIVIRPGVPDAKYLVPPAAFPALVDLPYEGHGVLIAPTWVVTAAHATSMMAAMPAERFVTVAGVRRQVLRVVVYPGFAASAAAFDSFNNQVGLGNVAAADTLLPEALRVQAGMHDVALLELAIAVDGVQPVPIYRGSAERGRVVELFGKGATGDGSAGEAARSPHRGLLRRAFNRVTRTDGQWLVYRFDCDTAALPLEGALGHGDSGGPALIDEHGRWMLAGIAHGMYLERGMRFTYRNGRFESGLCGQDFAYTRISYFAGWMDSVMTGRR